MAKQKKDDHIPILRVKKGDSLKTIYAKARKAFTAADLQKFTEVEEDIPVETVIGDLEAIHREETARKAGRKREKA